MAKRTEKNCADLKEKWPEIKLFMFGTFITITGDMVASTTGYIRDMITDTSPIWLIIVGVGAGLIIFEVIVHAIRGRQ